MPININLPLSKIGASIPTDKDFFPQEPCNSCDEIVWCDLCNDWHCGLWLKTNEKYCKYREKDIDTPTDPVAK